MRIKWNIGKDNVLWLLLRCLKFYSNANGLLSLGGIQLYLNGWSGNLYYSQYIYM